jgi:hypothetical protein
MHDEELLFVLLAKYYPSDQIKKNEMIAACGRRSVYRVSVDNPDEVSWKIYA